jgi:uncharacterized membrane protein YphA (DoxX/SURF4 family)
MTPVMSNGLGSGILLGSRLVVGAVLIYAGTSKLQHPISFLESVYKFELFSAGIGQAVAVVVPWLEIVCGAVLLAGTLLREAFLVALGLTVAFVAVQVHAIRNDLHVDCGCFGRGEGSATVIGAGTLIRTSGLMFMSGLGLVLSHVWVPDRAPARKSRALALPRPVGTVVIP